MWYRFNVTLSVKIKRELRRKINNRLYILMEAVFAIKSTYHISKVKNIGQLMFDRDIILPINHIENWNLMRQCKQEKINDDVNMEK